MAQQAFFSWFNIFYIGIIKQSLNEARSSM